MCLLHSRKGKGIIFLNSLLKVLHLIVKGKGETRYFYWFLFSFDLKWIVNLTWQILNHDFIEVLITSASIFLRGKWLVNSNSQCVCRVWSALIYSWHFHLAVDFYVETKCYLNLKVLVVAVMQHIRTVSLNLYIIISAWIHMWSSYMHWQSCLVYILIFVTCHNIISLCNPTFIENSFIILETKC